MCAGSLGTWAAAASSRWQPSAAISAALALVARVSIWRGRFSFLWGCACAVWGYAHKGAYQGDFLSNRCRARTPPSSGRLWSWGSDVDNQSTCSWRNETAVFQEMTTCSENRRPVSMSANSLEVFYFSHRHYSSICIFISPPKPSSSSYHTRHFHRIRQRIVELGQTILQRRFHQGETAGIRKRCQEDRQVEAPHQHAPVPTILVAEGHGSAPGVPLPVPREQTRVREQVRTDTRQRTPDIRTGSHVGRAARVVWECVQGVWEVLCRGLCSWPKLFK